MPTQDELPDLTDEECAALHHVDLAVEWLTRAHGHLLAFHHGTGHAMDHLAEAEHLLRASGHEKLADHVRDAVLPRGVVDGRWSYDVVESFETGLLADVEATGERVRDDVADGRRHVTERKQERDWRRRAEE
jgi:hypothetical protein